MVDIVLSCWHHGFYGFVHLLLRGHLYWLKVSSHAVKCRKESNLQWSNDALFFHVSITDFTVVSIFYLAASSGCKHGRHLVMTSPGDIGVVSVTLPFCRLLIQNLRVGIMYFANKEMGSGTQISKRALIEKIPSW